jgi:predicted Zn-dependent peptidase
MVFLTDRLHLAAWAATSSVLYLFHLPFSSQHLAFKGTSEIGSRDWRREEPLLKSLDEAGLRVRRLQEQFESVQAEALQLTVPNAFGAALQNEGGSGLNANTSQDQTK